MRSFANWIQRNLYFSLALLFLFFSAFLFLVFYITTENKFNWDTNVLHVERFTDYRSLDGMPVPKGYESLKPVAVMLENHVDSRPVAGLEDASIIYESIVEGDITRFLAIFDPKFKAEKVGPVRSARPFFVSLAEQWDPVYFHAGGSQQALEQLRYSDMYNINEISADGIYFWRDTTRSMPHNLFTSGNLIRRALVAKEIDIEANFDPWLFKDDTPADELSELVTEVEVNFSSNPQYQVRYEYDAQDNTYRRYLGGLLHKTERGIILKAKNIIVQYVTADVIDSYGRLDVDIVTGGKAQVYQDGKKIDARWETIGGRTYFMDVGPSPEQIKFNRGSIWIALIFN